MSVENFSQTNINKRETTSEFNHEGRTFLITSYDPLVGNYILMQILTSILPLGLGKLLNKASGSESVPTTETSSAKLMSKSDFINLQKDILSTVYEKFESGMKSPVVRENGTYGITDVSSKLFLNLMIASMAFNFKDFFEDVPSLKDSIQLPEI